MLQYSNTTNLLLLTLACNQNNIALAGYLTRINLEALMSLWLLYPVNAGYYQQRESRIDNNGTLSAIPTPYAQHRLNRPAFTYHAARAPVANTAPAQQDHARPCNLTLPRSI